MATERSAAAWGGSAAPSFVPIVDIRDQERARQHISRTYERLAAGWTRGDPGAIGALLASDCDHLMLGKRDVKRGRAELLASWTAAFARRCEQFSIELTPHLHGIRLLSSDLALVDGEFGYSAGIGTDGTPHEPSAQPFTAVMTRRGGETWSILSIRAGVAAAVAKAAVS